MISSSLSVLRIICLRLVFNAHIPKLRALNTFSVDVASERFGEHFVLCCSLFIFGFSMFPLSKLHEANYFAKNYLLAGCWERRRKENKVWNSKILSRFFFPESGHGWRSASTWEEVVSYCQNESFFWFCFVVHFVSQNLLLIYMHFSFSLPSFPLDGYFHPPFPCLWNRKNMCVLAGLYCF